MIRKLMGNLPFGSISFMNNTLNDWIYSFILFLLLFLFAAVFHGFLFYWLRRFCFRGKIGFSKFFLSGKRNSFLILCAAIFLFAVRNLTFDTKILKMIHAVWLVVTVVCSVFLFSDFLYYILEYRVKKFSTMDEQKSTDNALLKIYPFLNILIWITGTLFLLDNLGINISTLLAGLGIGGVAAAMALQSILGDLFSYLSILLDKPFELGDFIVIGEFSGTVDKIGIKTTKIKSVGGEQIIIPNSDLVKAKLKNNKRMTERRVVLNLMVEYSTPYEKLLLIDSAVKEKLSSMEQIRFDRVHLKEFGTSALIYEIVYYVISPDYLVYMDTREKIHLELFQFFAKQQINFAFPSRSLYFNSNL